MFENDEHLEEFPEEVAKKEKFKEEEQKINYLSRTHRRNLDYTVHH